MSISDPSETPNHDAKTGVLVLGYNRDRHLETVLESLESQGNPFPVHVWLDGTQARREFRGETESTLEVARRFELQDLRATKGHLGIEKLMLDALDQMTGLYDRVIVLEDDCFPRKNCIAQFSKALDDIAGRKDIYSVYGHHFGTEPAGDMDFTRFQGWGWAAHSAQIKTLLPELMRLFMLNEADYLADIERRLTQDIRDRLDVTPGRNVLQVLAQFYSWDSATTFLCAERKLLHRRTPDVSVVNTGIVSNTGHFHPGRDALRHPPFNMIEVNEAWDHF